MPRDATATKERLLREASRLMATRGVFAVNLRDIVAAAGQKNVSAIHYHFGGREDVLREILLAHSERLDVERGALAATLSGQPTTRELLSCLLIPYGSCLHTEVGCEYLRIVAQLADRFPAWDTVNVLNPPHLQGILRRIEAKAVGSREVKRQRIVDMLLLLTTSMADRARRRAEAGGLDEGAYLSNLADVLVALVEAPEGERLVPAEPVTD